jgi:hypothetical protein
MVCDRIGGFVFLLVLRERSAGCKHTVRNCSFANANGRLGLIGGRHIRELARGWTASAEAHNKNLQCRGFRSDIVTDDGE